MADIGSEWIGQGRSAMKRLARSVVIASVFQHGVDTDRAVRSWRSRRGCLEGRRGGEHDEHAVRVHAAAVRRRGITRTQHIRGPPPPAHDTPAVTDEHVDHLMLPVLAVEAITGTATTRRAGFG